MSRILDYVSQSLATVGVAVLDPKAMRTLRPDLWYSVGNFSADWATAGAGLDQILQRLEARSYIAVFESGNTARIATRSLLDLERRVEWITGRAVREIQPYEPPKPEAEPAQQVQNTQAHVNRLKAEKLSKLRKLAAQEPPSHDCSLRREILAARAELEQLGETWESAPIA